MNGDHCVEGGRCAEVLERLEAFLDGELAADEVGDLESHLAECYPCTDRATFEEQLRAIVARECVEHAPETLVTRIRDHLTDASDEAST